MYSTIQMAKKPAIIATTAATPPFANKEVAADEGVEEAAEDASEELVAPEPVVVPLLVPLGVDPEAVEDAGVPDAEDDAPLALAELGIGVNGIEVGVGVPEAERETMEGERIRNRAFTTIAKKNTYEHHILDFVKRQQFGDPQENSSFEDKERHRLGIERWCTRKLCWRYKGT